jgi:hypothetical protein
MRCLFCIGRLQAGHVSMPISSVSMYKKEGNAGNNLTCLCRWPKPLEAFRYDMGTLRSDVEVVLGK